MGRWRGAAPCCRHPRPQLGGDSNREDRMPNRKVCIVGVGKIAVDQHVPAINDSPDWELAATVSRQGSVEGVPTFRDFDVMLSERPDIEVVSPCLSPPPRLQYARHAPNARRRARLALGAAGH